jgi:hypothetical protein
VADTHPLAVHQDTDDIEPIRFGGPPMTIDPNVGRASQLLLFLPVDRFYRVTELASPACLDLDERNETLTFDHKINVPMSVAKPALNDPPAVSPKPPLRDPFSELSECLPGR